MKKSNKTLNGLKDGTYKKCIVCKSIEPKTNWPFDPVKGTYACIHCGISFHDPDMLKMVVILRNTDMSKIQSDIDFQDVIKHFIETSKRIKVPINPRITDYFRIKYKRNKVIIKEICYGETDFEWPFTIEKVTLKCFGKGQAIIAINPINGIEYALNGAAKDQYPSIDPIWRHIGIDKIPLSDVIAHIANDYDI